MLELELQEMWQRSYMW